MKLVAIHTPAGRLELALDRPEGLDAARALAVQHGAERAKLACRVTFLGRDAWLKASALRGRARLRHAVLHHVLRAPLPRVREALNLSWLEARVFQVPRPLAAGVLGAVPSWQFLVTQFVDGAPLDVVLRATGERERSELLLELARETARMHSLHFVHRDLFWRNVLVVREPAARKLVFLDAWRGGERLQWRTPAYDLACLFLEGPSLLRERETRAWLADYAAERAALGKPVAEARLWRAATSARRSLAARVRREPGRWRVPEPLVQEFDFAAAMR